MHRLWYDLRVESMFDERLRETVLRIDEALKAMIWRIVTRYSELVDREVGMDAASAYGVLDGLFQAALLGHVTGNSDALPTLVDQVHALMPLTLARRCGIPWTLSASLVTCAGPCSLPSRDDAAPVDAAAPRPRGAFLCP